MTAKALDLLETYGMIDDAELAPFRAQLYGWFDKHSVESVLVRPDRYVFGAGPASELVLAWSTHLP